MTESLNILWLTQLVMTSGLLVLFVSRAFADNATSRQTMAIISLALLLILPEVLWMVRDAFWHIAMQNPWNFMQR